MGMKAAKNCIDIGIISNIFIIIIRNYRRDEFIAGHILLVW